MWTKNKQNNRTVRALIPMALGLGLLLGFAPDAAAASKGPKASFVKGDVEQGKTAEGPFKKVKRNREVKPGAFLRVGENSRAELKWPDGSILRVGPSSLLHIKESGYNAKSKEVSVDATLVGGKAWAQVSNLVGTEAKFQVKSQNAVAGVRGTVFRINVDKDDATVVKVYDGAVAVSNSPFFQDKPDDKNAAASPIDPNRKQIASPFQEISKKEWEQIVAKMMEVRVGPDGKMSSASQFSAESDKLEDPEWVNWNLACNGGKCDAY